MAHKFYVYILECSDGSLYTGYTTDIQARLQKHEAGKGAKYTRGRGPFMLQYQEELTTKREAMKREYTIKQLTRMEKWKLIEASGKGGK